MGLSTARAWSLCLGMLECWSQAGLLELSV